MEKFQTDLAATSAPPQQRNPQTVSEWKLFIALDRAHLIQYFEKFISVGGDDLDQLSLANEKEFAEIINLIGMDSKPLHVRRLQKVLKEYRFNQKQFDRTALEQFKFAAKQQEELKETAKTENQSTVKSAIVVKEENGSDETQNEPCEIFKEPDT